MLRKFIITAVATHSIPQEGEELPDDCDSPEEALDAIKEELADQTFTLDCGDHGEVEFTITKVEDTEPEKRTP